MRVDSHDRYMDVGVFDPATGELAEVVRDPVRHVGFPSGHYARLAGIMVVLYRDQGDLWLRIGGTVQNLSDGRAAVSWKRSRSTARFALSVDGHELATLEYPVGQAGGPDDPTPFAEPEHWDFGLFVKNVLDDDGRRQRIYQRDLDVDDPG